eukprot:TRINITY_DN309089_c7_g1_i1.p1 TRINITY_DN309089_c7_g1~~TRINITY_DN309089_c7_g1_i1.p1  ORF type:complete len:478 (-),score=152.91 TRINITY_DN309089_c7_g1_i1:820-2253(-)
MGVKADLPLWQLIVLTLPWFGVQFSWSAEFATQTPYLESIGLTDALSTLTWASGAVTGFIVQPIVGVMSDRCKAKMGRRRPFIIGGVIATMLAQMIFAWSKRLGQLGGDSDVEGDSSSSSGTKTAALVIAIVAVWILGAAINIVQTPLRAIVADLASEKQQNLGQSLSSLWNAFGAICGFLVGKHALSIMHLYFEMAMALLFLTSVAACIIGKETQYTDGEDDSGDSACKKIMNTFGDVYRGIKSMPGPMIRICILQFFTWAVWFTYMPNYGVWLGKYVHNGSSSAPKGSQEYKRFQRGLTVGGNGQAIAAGVQLVYSFIAPVLTKHISVKKVYFGSFILLAVCFFGMGFIKPIADDKNSDTYSLILMGLSGIPLAATNIFPFALIGQIFEGDSNLGLYMGGLNIFIVLPQLMDTFYTGAVASQYGWNTVLRVGGMWSILALGMILLLKTTKKEEKGVYAPLIDSEERNSDVLTETI